MLAAVSAFPTHGMTNKIGILGDVMTIERIVAGASLGCTDVKTRLQA